MAVVQLLKDFVNLLTTPWLFIGLAIVLFFLALRSRVVWTPKFALAVAIAGALFIAVSMLDKNFALIVKKADNVPIVAMLFLVGFFWWLAMYQARQNDARIAAGQPPLEASDGENEKTWVWPDLVYTEMLCMIIGTIVLVVWSIALQAPIEEAANPSRTPNPSKAPWYFLGLQELVSYSAFAGGVLVPATLVAALLLLPFLDRKRIGVGRWFAPERRTANAIFASVFLAILVLTLVGHSFRGPNWQWQWPWAARPAAEH